MKVLVTGATGFIGNYVIEELRRRNLEIIATSAREEKAKKQSWFGAVQYIPFNFTRFNPATDYYTFFHQPDALIHLAWEGLPNYTASFHTERNMPVHKAFLENLITNGLKDVTVTGTCLEYGMQEGCLTETMYAMPANDYAAAKNELRKYIERLHCNFSFSFKWVRLFYMYGQGQNRHSLLSQLNKALEREDMVFNMSGGAQTRDYLPVEKVAAYIVKIALQKEISGIINCCSGRPVTVKQFVESYLKTAKKSIRLNLGYYPYPDYEPMHFWGSTEKLNKILAEKNRLGYRA